MGRVLLIGLAAVVLGACDVPADRTEDAHADLSCTACHSGPQGERGRATVPASSCQGSGCHEAGGPAEVQVATVTFPHRNHAEGHAIEATCAGCHTHATGLAPLEASVDACALCHVGDVSSSQAQECRLCHERPDHSMLTSQGVAVSHSQLPWIKIGCVRCHYDLAGAETEVSALECRQCHDDISVLNEKGVGRDLHPIHGGVTCTACHREGIHEVQAMSSAVELVCADCHREVHDVPLDLEEWPASGLCGECHAGVHVAQQRLLLGISPDGTVMPSEKFLLGMTCRSCHVSPALDPELAASPIRGQAESCTGCHEQEYEQVLDWWVEGSRSRLVASTRYVDGAATAVGSHSDSTRSLIDSARQMVGLVADAGGHHNLELSDRLMREAVSRAREAYRVAGVGGPPAPALGRVPHSGMCSYCHYGPDEPWNFGAMPDDFHRSVLTPER